MHEKLDSLLFLLPRLVLPKLLISSLFVSNEQTLTQKTGVDGESFYKAVSKVNFA